MSALAVAVMAVSSGTASAAVILTYKSATTVNGPLPATVDGVQLASSFNDAAFVTSFDATTSTDAATLSRTNNTNSTAGLGNTSPNLDLAFNFGGAMRVTNGTASNSTGAHIGTNFVAAQSLTLTDFSVRTDPNNGGNNFGARDITLFVSVAGGTFTQFGDMINRGNNNLQSNTFTDSVSVAAGETVEFRAVFTDFGSQSANNLQSFTRVGDINISADVALIPEPSSTALLGLGGLALILRRRK